MTQSQAFSCLYSFLEKEINNDYILLDLPYYTNVGDVLIWQSTINILKEIKHKCLYSASIETYLKPKINKKTLILFMGGGNYGDLWTRHQNFRYRVLNDYPYNKVIQLPQSVSFHDLNKIHDDYQRVRSHIGGFVMCVREQNSFDIFRENYEGIPCHLLPDMVLSLDVSKYIAQGKSEKGVLFAKRQDCESVDIRNMGVVIPEDADVKDWPTMDVNTQPKLLKLNNAIIDLLSKLHVPGRLIGFYLDMMYKHLLKDIILESGINFISSYRTVYSTRLHIAILSVLLEKEVYLIDNSYGKCSGVYTCWMKSYNNIRLL